MLKHPELQFLTKGKTSLFYILCRVGQKPEKQMEAFHFIIASTPVVKQIVSAAA